MTKKLMMPVVVGAMLLPTGVFGDFVDDDLRYNFESGSSTQVYVSGVKNSSATHITIPATVRYEWTEYTRDEATGKITTNKYYKTCNVSPISGFIFQVYWFRDLYEWRSPFYGCSNLTSVKISTGSYIGQYAFCDCRNLKSVTIPNSVTNIQDHAFSYCSGLTSVTIPDSVTSIGYRAFEGCSSLTSVTIPDSVTSIGSDAFSWCSGLTSVTIPNSVTNIGYSFVDCTNLTSVTIPQVVFTIPNGGPSHLFSSSRSSLKQVTILDGVTSIGAGAFYDFSGLTHVTIPDSVTSIGSSAFSGCSGLTGVTIGNGVTSIGYRAFEGCSSLTSVTIPSDVDIIGASAFSGCENLKTVTIADGVKVIEPGAFADCTNLTHVTIPDSMKSIGDRAFRNCSRLTSVTIPDSVTSIGEEAFENCRGLTSVTIGNGVTSIGYGVFAGCSGLTNVTIPDSVTSIGPGAFSGCSGLTSVTIPDSVTSIGRSAFGNCSGLTSVTIPDSVTNIGDDYGAFDGCTNLTSVTIPQAVCTKGLSRSLGLGGRIIQRIIISDGVTSIGAGAFNGCSGLTSVTIPDSVTSIGGWAFSGCSGLTSVTIPDSVTSIGSSAFYNCRGLTSVTIPDSVTSIGEGAFFGCSALTSVTIGNSVTNIGVNAFGFCTNLTSVTIPDSVVECQLAFPWSINSINFLGVRSYLNCFAHNDYYKSNSPCKINGVPIREIRTLVIPDTVTSIGNYAFRDCSGLTSVIIPDSVTNIGLQAFSGCSGLTSMTIPDSVTSIGGAAFSGCSGLTSVTIPDGVTSIGGGAFSGCSGLTRVTIPDGVTSIGNSAFSGCSGLTRVTIPDSVTSIGSSAFSGCSGLTRVTIPDSVTSIGDGAFSGCSGLTNVTIPDSVTSIGNSAFYGVRKVQMPIYLQSFVGTSSQYSYYPSRLSVPEPVARTAKISNVWAMQRAGTKYVDVVYDLEGMGGGTWDVSLKFYVDGKLIGARSLDGSVGAGVRLGKGRNVKWDAGTDWPGKAGMLTVTVTAGDSSMTSQPVWIDTRSGGFRIEDVSSAYCSGPYGSPDGKKATFLAGVHCQVDFRVKGGSEEYPIDHLLVNGVRQERKDGFSYPVNIIEPGGTMEVVAVDKTGAETPPFRVNFDVAALPVKWRTLTGAQVQTEEDEKRGLVLYYASDYNTLWLFEACQDAFEIAGKEYKLEFLPQLRFPESFDSATAQYRIGTTFGYAYTGGPGLPGAQAAYEKLKKQTFGKFIGGDLSFDLGGASVYEWNPYSLDYDRTGSDITAKMSYSMSLKYRFPAFPVAYVAVTALGSVEDKLQNIGCGEGWKVDLDFNPIIAIRGTVGAGVEGLCVEGYVQGGIRLRAMFDAATDASEFGGAVQYMWGVRGVVLGFERKFEDGDEKWFLGGPKKNMKAAMKLLATSTPASDGSFPDAGFTPIPRDYGRTSNARSPRLMKAALQAAGSASLGDGYPNPAPSLATGDGTDHLAYLRDNSGRSAINRTEVVYRSGASNVWGTAQTVWDDGTADFMPKVAVATNGTVFLAWANAKRALADADTLEATCRSLELAVGVRGGGSGAWACTNLTDDAALDMNPVVRTAADGSAAVAWMRNPSGEFFASADKPAEVMLATYRNGAWAVPVKVADAGALVALDLAWDGTSAEIVWSKDGDGNAATEGDREIWGATVAGGTVGAAARLSDAGADSTRPHVWFAGDGTVRKVWLADGVLAAEGGTRIAGADALDLVEDFALLPRPDGGASLAWWPPPRCWTVSRNSPTSMKATSRPAAVWSRRSRPCPA